MIIRIGAAVFDGLFPDESALSPVQEIETSEGVVLISKPARRAGLRLSLSISLVQHDGVSLLNQYLTNQTPEAISFVDQSLADSKAFGNVIVERVDLNVIDQNAMALLKLSTMSGELSESVYAGSIGVITC